MVEKMTDEIFYAYLGKSLVRDIMAWNGQIPRDVKDALAGMTVNLENCKSDVDAITMPKAEGESGMGKIERIILVNGQRRKITASNEQEYAEKCARILTGQVELLPKETREKHGFKAYALNWFEVFAKPNIEQATAVTYKRQLDKHILPVLGEKNLEEISASDVQAVFNSMGNVAVTTKRKAKNVLNMVLTQAVDDRLIDRNPLESKSVKIKGTSSRQTEPYTVEQMRYLVGHIDQIKNEQDRAFLALLALHPMRLEEVLGLQGADIDGNTIHIRRAVTHPQRNKPEIKKTKTDESARDLELVEQIKPYLPETAPQDFIIGGKNPLSCQQVKRMCERIQRDTGFSENITPIRFRTTVLTDLYDQTKDIKQTQKAAGHTNVNTTLRYYVKGRDANADTASPVASVYGLN